MIGEFENTQFLHKNVHSNQERKRTQITDAL